MKSPRAIQEATGILVGVGVLLGLSLAFFPPLAFLWLAALAFVVYFFRDPDRAAPNDASLAVAAADGRVVSVDERMVDLDEPSADETLQRPMVCVSIFLSVLDVHVNRAPIAGRVTLSVGRPGKFLDARNPDSARKNASRLWIIEGAGVTVAVRQVTGAIARRIVPWSRVGDTLTQGEKFGMIRFGSRTEIYLPPGSQVLVKPGDTVRGGVTPLAALPGVAPAHLPRP